MDWMMAQSGRGGYGDHHTTVTRLPRTIDNQQITIVYAEAHHGVTLDPNEEGRFFVLDQVLVKAEPGLDVIGRW